MGLYKKIRELIKNPKQYLENSIIKQSERIKQKRADATKQPQFGLLPAVTIPARLGNIETKAGQSFMELAKTQFLLRQNVSLTDAAICGVLVEQIPPLLAFAARYAALHNLHCTFNCNKGSFTIAADTLAAPVKYASRTSEFSLSFIDPLENDVSQFGFFVYENKPAEQLLYCKASYCIEKKISNSSLNGDLANFGAASEQNWDTRIDFPIDIVYTWVNHEDPKWREMLGAYKSEIQWDRYLQNDELRYSLRSVEKYAPWVRTIYVLTNCRPPNWLREHPKIRWIDHSEIIDQRYLPTFNSHAIESYLAYVPNISEHFVYFNDDVFLTRPCLPQKFFTSNGLSLAYLEPYGMVPEQPNETTPDYLHAAIRGRKLIEKKFGRSPVQLHLHTPHSICKSILLDLEADFPDEFRKVRSNRFRDSSDISPVSFLYHHYGYQRQKVIRSTCSSALITTRNFKRMTKERLPKLDFLCINDGGGSAEDSDFQNFKIETLEWLFPWRAEWEIEA